MLYAGWCMAAPEPPFLLLLPPVGLPPSGISRFCDTGRKVADYQAKDRKMTECQAKGRKMAECQAKGW